MKYDDKLNELLKASFQNMPVIKIHLLRIFFLALVCQPSMFAQQLLLDVDGAIKVGDLNTSETEPGTIRFHGQRFEG